MPAFSKNSLAKLATCHPALVQIMNRAIIEFDFSVICGHRGKEDQDAAVARGASKTPWPTSKHNKNPSHAVDIVPYPAPKTEAGWKDPEYLAKQRSLAKIVLRIADELYIPIRWGGDFNMDGDKTVTDSWDMPHFELIYPNKS